MKVVMKNNINQVPFASLIIGDVFIYDNTLFMKIEVSFNATNSKAYNTVRLVRRFHGRPHPGRVPAGASDR